MAAACRYAVSAPVKSWRVSEQLPYLNQRRRVGGIELDGASESVYCRVGVTLPLPHDSKVTVQKRAVGGCCDRAFVGACRLVQSAGCGRGARGVDQILKTAETQHIHPPPHICQRCIGSQRRFECFERRRVALERKEHLTAADERRHIGWRRPQHAVERTERPIEVCGGERHVRAPGACGIKPGRPFQRVSKLSIRALKIVAPAGTASPGRRARHRPHRQDPSEARDT